MTNSFQTGFLRDEDGVLVTVDYADADSPFVDLGFLRDSTGALVTISAADATDPTGYLTGFVRDANNALVINEATVSADRPRGKRRGFPWRRKKRS